MKPERNHEMLPMDFFLDMVKRGGAPPSFVVKGKRRKRLWLVCSVCKKKLRNVKRDERVDALRAYFCKLHDPGYRVENKPH